MLLGGLSVNLNHLKNPIEKLANFPIYPLWLHIHNFLEMIVSTISWLNPKNVYKNSVYTCRKETSKINNHGLNVICSLAS